THFTSVIYTPSLHDALPICFPSSVRPDSRDSDLLRKSSKECLPHPIPFSGNPQLWFRFHKSCRPAPEHGSAGVSRLFLFPNRWQGFGLLRWKRAPAEQVMTRQRCFAWVLPL